MHLVKVFRLFCNNCRRHPPKIYFISICKWRYSTYLMWNNLSPSLPRENDLLHISNNRKQFCHQNKAKQSKAKEKKEQQIAKLNAQTKKRE